MRSETVNGRKQIVCWHGWAGDEAQALQRAVDVYNRSQTNVHVKMVSIAGSYEKMKIAFAGGDTPDVCSTVWGSEIVDYAIRDTLEPLDAYMKKDGFDVAQYSGAIQNIFSYEGKTYALTQGVATHFIFFNKRIFREVGLDPENPPKNTDEFNRAVALTTRYANNDPAQGLERLGFPFAGRMFRLCIPFGVSYWDAETQTVFPNPDRLVACLNWMKSNIDRVGWQKQQAFAAGFGNQVSPNNPFITGKVAMVEGGDWYASVIRQFAPADFEWGFFPLPAPAIGGKPNSTFLEGSMWVIPAASRSKPEAWDFLKHITSAESIKMARLNPDVPSGVPPLRKMYDWPEYQKPFWKFTIGLIESPNALPPPEVPLFTTMIAEMERLEERVLSGDVPPEAGVEQFRKGIQAKVDEVLKSAGKLKAK